MLGFIKHAWTQYNNKLKVDAIKQQRDRIAAKLMSGDDITSKEATEFNTAEHKIRMLTDDRYRDEQERIARVNHERKMARLQVKQNRRGTGW